MTTYVCQAVRPGNKEKHSVLIQDPPRPPPGIYHAKLRYQREKTVSQPHTTRKHGWWWSVTVNTGTIPVSNPCHNNLGTLGLVGQQDIASHVLGLSRKGTQIRARLFRLWGSNTAMSLPPFLSSACSTGRHFMLIPFVLLSCLSDLDMLKLLGKKQDRSACICFFPQQ